MNKISTTCRAHGRKHHAGIFAICAAMVVLGCKPASDATPPGSAEQFGLKEYLCVIAPGECNRKDMQRLLLAPPDARYEAKLGDKLLRVPMGHVDPIEIGSPDPTRRSLFLTGNWPGLRPRGRDNMTDFIRSGPRPTVIRFNLRAHGAEPAAEKDRWIREVKNERIKERPSNFEFPKRYPDVHQLRHLGNDYGRARWVKPCEREGEMQQCGTVDQDDIYVPLTAAYATTWIECASWMYLSNSTAQKEVQMTTAERDNHYQSDEFKRPRWRMAREPHCRHAFYHESLGSAVYVTYHLALLPEWQRIEQRVRDLLDASLVK